MLTNINDLKYNSNEDRVYILAPGKSLKYLDFQILADNVTIAFNDIYKIYDVVDWRPTFYLNNHDARRDNVMKGLTKSLESNSVVIMNETKSGGNILNKTNNRLYKIDTWGVKRPQSQNEISDLVRRYWFDNHGQSGYYSFGSSLSLAVQMACKLGFDNIVILGADLYDESMLLTKIIKKGEDPGEWLIKTKMDNKFDLLPLIKKIKNSEAPLSTSLNFAYYAMLHIILQQIPTRSINHVTGNYASGGEPGIDYKSRNKLYEMEYRCIAEGCDISNIKIENGTMINKFDFIDTFESKWLLYDC